MEKRPKCVWFGCFGGLIKNVEAKEITVTPNDISTLVLNQIDETELRKIITETVPSSHDLNVLYMVSDLGSKLSKFAITMYTGRSATTGTSVFCKGGANLV